MNTRYPWNQPLWLALIGLLSVVPAALAQTDATATASKPDETVKLEKFIVTGSMIKRIPNEGALPVEIITRQNLDQRGITSVEQMIMELNINGNGLDNLASNADVVSGAQRGNNGATSANLRGQGNNATLILLNGRRIAAHGLNGGTVDLNSIPLPAIERVEILKDGASAIYGTDAVGGVINFITRTNFTGLVANAATDVTQEGGGRIDRYSLTGGIGDLAKDKFNLMGTFSVTDSKILRGDQRDFVNTFQPERGLSPDTRGTPIATLFAVSTLNSVLSRDNLNNAGRSAGPIDPANPALRVNGINIIDLPTNTAGYAGLDGMGPYDEVLWNSPASKYGSAWDTGRAAVLQQPVKNTNLVLTGTGLLGKHRLIAEAVLGRSESRKSFSPSQWSVSTLSTTRTADNTLVANPLFNLAYPSTGADYTRVFNALVAFFPALEPNRGLPMAFRWRSLPVGNRELSTRSNTRRYLLALEGPLPFFSDWEYRTGFSRATSQSRSVLSHGYVFSLPFTDLIKSGVINPFSYTQTPEAQAAIDKTRADGVKLFGGKFTTNQADFTTSGPVVKLPAGIMQAAVGVDLRTEKYNFKGDQRTNVSTADSLIANAPFDNALATAGTLKRDIRAAFVELQVPVFKGLDLNAAARNDHYTGFGSSTNPKITLRYAPSDKILFRSSYSTGFRVPTFKQIFDPITESPFSGTGFIDPQTGLQVPANSFVTRGGGKRDLNPEDAEMYSAGIVFAPSPHFSGNLDWWSVNRTGTIQIFDVTTLAKNFDLFNDRFIRDASGALIAVDTRWTNAGETVTKGLEFGLRGNVEALGGKIDAGIDVSYLLTKKSRLLANTPFGPSEINRFTRSSDLGIRWKHTAFVTYRRGNWQGRLSQVYRGSYLDAVLPGVQAALNAGTPTPPNWSPRVKAYDIFHFSLTYTGLKNTKIIAGVKNLFNTDPPFSAAYDTNTGAGSSWEPRVADPRGRSFTLSVEYKYK